MADLGSIAVLKQQILNYITNTVVIIRKEIHGMIHTDIVDTIDSLKADVDGGNVNPTTWKTALSLENVDNTSDSDKPISTATQTALDDKADIDAGNITPSTWKTALSLNNVDNTSDVNKPISTATQSALDTKADLDSGNLSAGNITSWKTTLGINDKAEKDASNLTAGDVISWQNKLGIAAGYEIKEYDIGAWDLSTDSGYDITHGLSSTEWKTIIVLSYHIRNDADTVRLSFPYNDQTTGVCQLFIFGADSTGINIGRLTGSSLDNIAFSSTGFNRGKLLIAFQPD
jgi:hypothetical protein